MFKIRGRFILYGLLLTLVAGCKKFVTVPPPPTSLNSDNVYQSDGTAAAVMTQLYASVVNGGGNIGQLDGFFLTGGMSADELTLFNLSDATALSYYTNALVPLNTGVLGPWFEVYTDIFTTNAVIDGVTGNNLLTPAVSQQLLGEAKFMRGFFYFYLVNIYGEVPLVTNTNAKANALNYRATVDSVYGQIIGDLTDAEALLSDNYLGPDLQTVTTAKLRPTKWAATALLARVYLYHQDYPNAYAQANSVIGSNLFGLDSLDAVFLMNSHEAIWQLQNINLGRSANTPEGQVFILPATGPGATNGYEYYLNNALVNSFEPGDSRRTHWIDSVVVGSTAYYYPYKYKAGAAQLSTQSEYQMVFRLGEQYLIRAEAEANGAGGGLSAAVNDLDAIRQRAGLPGYAGPVTTDSVMAALLNERRVELFTEWGHRWFDLKRWPVASTLNSVMIPAALAKGAVWNPDNHQALFPIPQVEIEFDLNLTQNPGY